MRLNQKIMRSLNICGEIWRDSSKFVSVCARTPRTTLFRHSKFEPCRPGRLASMPSHPLSGHLLWNLYTASTPITAHVMRTKHYYCYDTELYLILQCLPPQTCLLTLLQAFDVNEPVSHAPAQGVARHPKKLPRGRVGDDVCRSLPFWYRIT